ncbi:hypothetical protein JW766_03725 [Candidatus Dojkabacteria bacterium]|nr:hypothetical protein [Candidatus Dojkabacteria bacterium]
MEEQPLPNFQAETRIATSQAMTVLYYLSTIEGQAVLREHGELSGSFVPEDICPIAEMILRQHDFDFQSRNGVLFCHKGNGTLAGYTILVSINERKIANFILFCQGKSLLFTNSDQQFPVSNSVDGIKVGEGLSLKQIEDRRSRSIGLRASVTLPCDMVYLRGRPDWVVEASIEPWRTGAQRGVWPSERDCTPGQDDSRPRYSRTKSRREARSQIEDALSQNGHLTQAELEFLVGTLMISAGNALA